MNKVNVNKVVDYANLLKENEQLHSIIKEARELLNQEWYSVLRKGTITKVKEILDKVEENTNGNTNDNGNTNNNWNTIANNVR